jgi:hypothetical protein
MPRINCGIAKNLLVYGYKTTRIPMKKSGGKMYDE